MIAVADPRGELAPLRAEIDTAIGRVLDSGRYILGPEVEAFEREFAAYCGAAHAIGVASGTDALMLALRACGVSPGDEVLTVAHTAVAPVAAIVAVGATPVFVDVDPDRMTLDPRLIEGRLSSRTAAIVPVHLYGNAADVEPIVRLAHARGVRVVEDASQAHGTRIRGRHVGTFGDAGIFSFYPTKGLGAVGDGGAIITNDVGLARCVRLFRQYGWHSGRISTVHGVNSRLDELQAAILRVRLRHLDSMLAMRRGIGDRYLSEISETKLRLPHISTDIAHSFHLFVARTPARDHLARHLGRNGIASAVHYAPPVHLQPAYRELGTAVVLRETERAASEVLSLPLHSALRDEDVDKVLSAVDSWTAG